MEQRGAGAVERTGETITPSYEAGLDIPTEAASVSAMTTSAGSPRRTLSNRASFWTAASVVALALWASGAPAMMYPLYTAEWNLTPAIITTIFAVYPISLVVTLIVFGSISDYVGRRATLLVGVGFVALGILMFAVAPGLPLLLAGRVLQGIGVGLAMAPASAAMVEFSTSGTAARASSINTASTALGLALATVVGGAFVEYGPLPMHLAFWLLLALSLGIFTTVWFMPSAAPGTLTAGRWRPQSVGVPRGLRVIFAVSSLSIAAGFSMGALLLSLGSQIAKDLIHTDNALVAGSVLAVSAVTIGTTAILSRRIPPRISTAIGGVLTAIGMGLLALSAQQQSLALFLVASLVAGAGYGLLFLGGLGLINRHAPTHHRAATLSSVYLVAYLTQGIVAVAIGLTATRAGLEPALDIWSPIIAGVCIAATALALASRPRRATVAA